MVGPAPCPIERIQGQYRWHLLVKGHPHCGLGQFVSSCAGIAEKLGKKHPEVRISVDPEPQSLI
ncbi:TPA: hypothetical protein DD394_04405 [bacterium UBP9_UBA11836]|nr:hypothetical protein [bacterium UBP9_UBA11836]